MKLEVGMYAYSKSCRDYGIGKIVDITESGLGFKGDLVDIQYRHSKHAIENNDVIAGFDIIDLIEVGDYVNGHKVTRIGGTYHGRKDRAIYCDYQQNEKTKKWIMIYDDEIKSIVTKEQFEEMSYKIKE